MGIGAGTAAAIAAVAGIASAAVSYMGAQSAASAASKNANYQAQVAANNQQIAEQNAKYATEAGTAKAEAQSLKGAAASGAIKAAIGANSVDVNSGSAVDVQETQKEINALDTQTVENNALLQAYGYRSQATNFGAESQLQAQEASQAGTAGDLAGAGSLLSGASSVGFKYAGTASGGNNVVVNDPYNPNGSAPVF